MRSAARSELGLSARPIRDGNDARNGFRRPGHSHGTAISILEETVGLKDDVTGKAKEAEGKISGDKTREAEGKLDQAKGKAKDTIDDTKDAVKK